jgi:hypothetical protein
MRSPRITHLLTLGLIGVVALAATAGAKPKPKPTYHFLVSEVTAADGIAGDVVTAAQPRIKAQVEKAFAEHPQLVAALEGAPDPKANPKAYTAFLKKKKVAGAYRVNVEITSAVEETEDMEAKPGQLRLVVRLSLKMFGETIPQRVMGFTGEGSATIKQEVGKKVRPRDREFAWDQAAELAINDAIATSLAKLALPPARPTKK